MRRRRAFTLVEVVLAVGIITFAVTAILGLLAMATDSERAAASDTALAAMCGVVYSDLRAKDYAALAAAPSAYYFDADGAECPPAKAIYKCDVILADDPDLTPGNLKRARMIFSWPPGAARSETRVIHGAIANHGN